MSKLRDHVFPLSQGAKVYPDDLAGVIGQAHVGNVWYVDANNGSDNNKGDEWGRAFATYEQALDQAVTNNYDVIVIAPGGTSGTGETSALTLSKNHVTTIGASAPAPWSPRSRITFGAGTSSCLTVSGQGNRFVGVQLATFEDNNVLVEVTANRNVFVGCHLAGIGNATAGDDTAARTLLINGAEECGFYDCTIGLDTVARSTTNAEIEFKSAATRHLFENCRIVAFADNAGHKFVKADDAASAVDRVVIFKDSIFFNAIDSTATQMDEAIVAHASLGGMIFVKNCSLIGADDWDDADTGKVMIDGAAPTAGTSGLAVDTTA